MANVGWAPGTTPTGKCDLACVCVQGPVYELVKYNMLCMSLTCCVQGPGHIGASNMRDFKTAKVRGVRFQDSHDQKKRVCVQCYQCI